LSIKLPDVQRSEILALPPRVRSIGHAEYLFVQMAMADIARQWSVELLGASADDSTLVLVPEDGDDAVGPSFMICRESYGFRLDQVHWDTVTEIGIFASIGDVVDTLRTRLAHWSRLVAPSSVTLH
jgi:hypothetical protein